MIPNFEYHPCVQFVDFNDSEIDINVGTSPFKFLDKNARHGLLYKPEN